MHTLERNMHVSRPSEWWVVSTIKKSSFGGPQQIGLHSAIWNNSGDQKIHNSVWRGGGVRISSTATPSLPISKWNTPISRTFTFWLKLCLYQLNDTTRFYPQQRCQLSRESMSSTSDGECNMMRRRVKWRNTIRSGVQCIANGDFLHMSVLWLTLHC